MKQERTIRVALLGAGSVGSQIARMLLTQRAEYQARCGADLELIGIAVRNVAAPRDVELPQQLLTADAAQLVAAADLVIEVMGGIEPARTLILQAIAGGADVVTANKALLAAHGPELHAAARAAGVQLSYEAAVAGAIPVLRPLLSSLVGDNVQRVMGIVNGSTNYILDSMHRAGKTAPEAMQIASELGYLEADPTLDVEGYDAAQKAAILARLAFHTEMPSDAVYREGITKVSAADVALAQENEQVIKLLAIIEKTVTAAGEPAVAARVYPALIPASHPLAAVHGGKNAIFVEAENAGELMFYGAGAGGAETASAVLGDVLSAARRMVGGGAPVDPPTHAVLHPLQMTDMTTSYQVRLAVSDAVAAVSELTALCAAHQIAVVHVAERGSEVALTTVRALEVKQQRLVAEMAELPHVTEVLSVLRSEAVAA